MRRNAQADTDVYRKAGMLAEHLAAVEMATEQKEVRVAAAWQAYKHREEADSDSPTADSDSHTADSDSHTGCWTCTSITSLTEQHSQGLDKCSTPFPMPRFRCCVCYALGCHGIPPSAR